MRCWTAPFHRYCFTSENPALHYRITFAFEMRGKAGTKQVRLRALFVSALPRPWQEHDFRNALMKFEDQKRQPGVETLAGDHRLKARILSAITGFDCQISSEASSVKCKKHKAWLYKGFRGSVIELWESTMPSMHNLGTFFALRFY